MPTTTVAGHRFDLDSVTVREALRDVLPEPIREHFVVINGRRWPPKQVLALVTGLDRADFTTHQARRVLTRLGFPAARTTHPKVGSAAASTVPAPRTGEKAPYLADALRPFIGQWVAVRGDDVLVAADSATDVVAWLAEHQLRAQAMFRVADSEQAVIGAAPR